MMTSKLSAFVLTLLVWASGTLTPFATGSAADVKPARAPRPAQRDEIPHWPFALAFSPDSKTLAVGWSNPAKIDLVDPATRKRRAILRGHKRAVYWLQFTTNGQALFSLGSIDGTLRRWSLKTHKSRILWKAKSGFITIDGKQIIRDISTLPQTDVNVNDLASGKRLHVLKHTEVPMRWPVSPDGRLLATGQYDGVIRLWDFRTGKQRQVFKQDGAFHSLEFSNDGSKLVAVAALEVVVWDLKKGKRFFTLRDNQTAAALSADHSTVAVGGDRVVLWSVRKKIKVATFSVRPKQGRGPLVYRLRFSPDSKYLAAGLTDGRLLIWNVANKLRRATESNPECK